MNEWLKGLSTRQEKIRRYDKLTTADLRASCGARQEERPELSGLLGYMFRLKNLYGGRASYHDKSKL
jgi:hypothetical protein